MKLTLNDFFAYSSPWVGDNSNRCGNQMKSSGWISPVTSSYDLIIEKMPKATFAGKLVGRGEDHYLSSKSITGIISEVNKKLSL